MFGGDECVRTQVRQFINLLKGLARKHNCAILLLAHPSLTGMNTGTGLSGSTDWNNGVRSRLYHRWAAPLGVGRPALTQRGLRAATTKVCRKAHGQILRLP
jgi:RecA-family ATPase